MKSPRDLVLDYYFQNPNTEEKAIDIAKKFNFRPELDNFTRAKTTRDLKRLAISKYNTSKKQGSSVLKSQSATEIKEDLQNQTLSINTFSNEPRTAEEIIALHKIDTSVWKLSQFWSKEKSNGWQVSAMFSSKKENEISAEDIDNILSKVFSNNEVKYSIDKSKSEGVEKGLFVYMSDKHIGALTKEDSNYSNTYNRMVFRERLQSTFNKIEQLSKEQGKFDTIFICDLGDSVDGWNGYTTRGGHKLPQNMSNREVFETYVEEHKIFFDNLMKSGFASDYKVIFQTNSNHGGDFEYISAKAISYYLKGTYNIEVILMEKFLEHIEYGEHVFILTHGKDTEDLKFGLPLQLNDKTENYINKYITYHNIDLSKNIHVIKGDLHSESQQLGQHFRYRNVLSMYGSSKWIHSNFGPGMAGVSFDIVEKNYDTVFSFYTRFN